MPPQASAAGHRAEDWNLGEPRFTGRLHLVGVGSTLECRVLKQGDGQLPMAVCPVRTGDKAPPVDAVVCAVVDVDRTSCFECEDAKGAPRRRPGSVECWSAESATLKASIDDFVRAARREATAVLREAAEEAAAIRRRGRGRRHRRCRAA